MRSPSTPPFTVTREKASHATPAIPLHCAHNNIDWLKAVVHDVAPLEKGHTVTIEIMRRKPGQPSSVVQNESALVKFTIDELHTVNTVFDAEALTHIEQHYQRRFQSTICARLSIGLGAVAELKIECDKDGSNAFAILVFATYGGGYYAQRSAEIQFRPAKIE